MKSKFFFIELRVLCGKFLILLLLGAALSSVHAFDGLQIRDSAVAERYALWAMETMDRGQWSEALAGLERAADFADVSSDISYLLALARSHQNKSRGSVLEALNQALYLDIWKLCDRESAHFLRAETFFALRAYQQALADLSRVNRSVEEAELRLKVMAAQRHSGFFACLTEVLDLYPREPGPVRIFFNFLKAESRAGRSPNTEQLEILELVIRRLPALLLHDRELAWMAAPFKRDSDEAGRLVLAYRAVNKPVPESLPAALRLGILNEESALEELFAGSVLDKALLDEVWELLRREEAKSLFRRNLSVFTGVITEDSDEDGIPESFAEYSGGLLRQFNYDANQDAAPGLTVYFEAGEPKRGLTLIPPLAVIQWERYPAILEVELEGVRYIPRPFDFHFSPFKFADLWGSGLLFPEWDSLTPPLTMRVLVSSVHRIQRPSLEFSGGIEVVELNQGIPVSAREYVGDRIVSETEFLRGRPQLQRVDLALSGRFDTVRRFSKNYRPMELEELWNYDRDIERVVTVNDWETEW